MPGNQEAGQAAPDWSQESVEKAAAVEAEKPKPEGEQAEGGEPAEQTEAEPKVQEVRRKEKVVPYDAFHEERAKRKEATQRYTALEGQFQQLARQQQELLARLQPKEAAPDLATDPAAALLHAQKQTQEQLNEIAQKQARGDQDALQRQQVTAFVAHVREQNESFTKEQPDANEGIAFLKNSRVEEYRAMGMSEVEAKQRMLKDEWDLTQWAVQNGENPAQVAFNMAKVRGYVSPKQKLEMQKEGQGASTPSGGAGKSGGPPSLEALLKMPAADFAKATEGGKWEQLLKKHS